MNVMAVEGLVWLYFFIIFLVHFFWVCAIVY